MIVHQTCPFCNAAAIRQVLQAVDYTVTHETFAIYECSHCTNRFTQNIPLQATIGRYYASENYISHTDTQQGLVNQLYHRVRNHTLKTKCRLIKKHTGLSTGQLLDVGCGTGAFLHTMQQNGWQISGIEPDVATRVRAATLYHIQPAEPEQLFLYPNGQFNVITLWHVLEHVHDLHGYLHQLKKLLQKEGKLFIAVPNYTSADANIYGAHWAAYDVPRHLYHFSPAGMRSLMAACGMKVEAIQPMWFDSFYVSLLSEKYKNGKGNLLKAVFNGLRSNSRALLDKEKCSSLIYIIRI
jgi:SAM-dependent methyltransferase